MTHSIVTRNIHHLLNLLHKSTKTKIWTPIYSVHLHLPRVCKYQKRYTNLKSRVHKNRHDRKSNRKLRCNKTLVIVICSKSTTAKVSLSFSILSKTNRNAKTNSTKRKYTKFKKKLLLKSLICGTTSPATKSKTKMKTKTKPKHCPKQEAGNRCGAMGRMRRQGGWNSIGFQLKKVGSARSSLCKA